MSGKDARLVDRRACFPSVGFGSAIRSRCSSPSVATEGACRRSLATLPSGGPQLRSCWEWIRALGRHWPLEPPSSGWGLWRGLPGFSGGSSGPDGGLLPPIRQRSRMQARCRGWHLSALRQILCGAGHGTFSVLGDEDREEDGAGKRPVVRFFARPRHRRFRGGRRRQGARGSLGVLRCGARRCRGQRASR